jgi:hypothetical protein
VADKYDSLTPELSDWIEQQPVFFVASAARDGRINLSPKGQDSLKVLGPNTLLWLNLTGSGNETAAHLRDTNRLTLMWCAFAGPPRILRVYGTADTIHPRDSDWQHCEQILPAPLGARQYFRMHIELVQTSCGYAVPLMDYQEDRTVLQKWSEQRGQAGIEAYWQTQNVLSLDGQPTGIGEQDNFHENEG